MGRRGWIRGVGLTLAGGALLAAALAGCGRGEGGREESLSGRAADKRIRMIGSTTVLPLAEKWREAFNEVRPEIDIAVSGGGSGTGIKALISGTAEIAMSSREIKPREMEQAQEAGLTLAEHLVAYDGIAVIVHAANPLGELSVDQLSDIYAGRVSDWASVGARGLGEIQVVSRDSASGTYEAFKDLVVTRQGTDKTRDYAAAALKQTSNQAVLALVSKTKGAIGYVGLGYLDDSVRALRVVPMGGGEAAAATGANVASGTYPVSRSLYCYTAGEPEGVLKEFLDWVKGSEGQAVVAELGFVPVK